MKILVKIGLVATTLLSTQSLTLASDHHYKDDNAYFASKYHRRDPHHWRKSSQNTHKPKHWGRHHHHGIALDGNDGRP